MDDRKPWVMPEWMKDYEKYFQNTGGWPVEELMNKKVDSRTNLAVAMLQVSVDSQVTLLTRLLHAGKLVGQYPVGNRQD